MARTLRAFSLSMLTWLLQRVAFEWLFLFTSQLVIAGAAGDFFSAIHPLFGVPIFAFAFFVLVTSGCAPIGIVAACDPRAQPAVARSLVASLVVTATALQSSIIDGLVAWSSS